VARDSGPAQPARTRRKEGRKHERRISWRLRFAALFPSRDLLRGSVARSSVQPPFVFEASFLRVDPVSSVRSVIPSFADIDIALATE